MAFKEIFNETLPAGTHHMYYITNIYGEGPRVHRRAETIHASTYAHYDAKFGVLLVIHAVDFHVDNQVAVGHPRRILETHAQKSDAVRRAVALADDWHADVVASLPPYDDRDDEVLIAEWQINAEEVPY